MRFAELVSIVREDSDLFCPAIGAQITSLTNVEFHLAFRRTAEDVLPGHGVKFTIDDTDALFFATRPNVCEFRNLPNHATFKMVGKNGLEHKLYKRVTRHKVVVDGVTRNIATISLFDRNGDRTMVKRVYV